jgi:hypothetical protein
MSVVGCQFFPVIFLFSPYEEEKREREMAAPQEHDVVKSVSLIVDLVYRPPSCVNTGF